MEGLEELGGLTELVLDRNKIKVCSSMHAHCYVILYCGLVLAGEFVGRTEQLKRIAFRGESFKRSL